MPILESSNVDHTAEDICGSHTEQQDHELLDHQRQHNHRQQDDEQVTAGNHHHDEEEEMILRHAAGHYNEQQQPAHNSITTAVCVGCRNAIGERYFLSVSQEAWHSHCLKCSLCRGILDGQMVCYYKDGMILCKDDYYKYKVRAYNHQESGGWPKEGRCHGCRYAIRPDEFVMRVRELVFHVMCFRCLACQRTLHTGDRFTLRQDGALLCQRHFSPQPPSSLVGAAAVANSGTDPATATLDMLPPNDSSSSSAASSQHANCMPLDSYSAAALRLELQQPHPGPPVSPVPSHFTNRLVPYFPAGVLRTTNNNTNNDDQGGSPQLPQLTSRRSSKGRNRRRKSQQLPPLQTMLGFPGDREDLTINGEPASTLQELRGSSRKGVLPALDHHLDQQQQCYMTDQSSNMLPSHAGHQLSFSPSSEDSSQSRLESSSPGGGLHVSHSRHSHTDSSSPTPNQSSHQRTKRMRTSFKHQQLRSMKQYFGINHNPDAKDLKQLAQKTGLTKRVLQVWFQNARAKYRRSLLKSDPNRAMEASPLGPSNTNSSKAHSLSPSRRSLTPTNSTAGGYTNIGGGSMHGASSLSGCHQSQGQYPLSNTSNSQDLANDYY